MQGVPEEQPSDVVSEEEAAPLPRRRRRWLFWGALAVFAVLVAVFGWVQASHAGRVAGGVSVIGVRLGGLTESEAKSKLSQEIERRGLMTTVLRTADGESMMLPLERLGVSIDVPATVEAALRSGRVRMAGVSIYTGGDAEVAPVVTVDTATYLTGLVVLGDKVDRAARDASLRLQGGRPVVEPAADGVAVDDVALERAILAAVTAGRPFQGSVPVMSVSPAISTAEVEAMAGAATRYLQRPLVLRYRDRTVRLLPATLATLLAVNREADADTNPLTFANATAQAYLRRALAFAERPAVDARVEVHGSRIVITPSRDGIQIDMQRLLSDMDEAAAQGGGLRAIFVRVNVVAPRYTDEALREMGLGALGSEFATYFDAGNPTRAANIALCAKLVDGAIVAPGKVFSLNARVGPRTLNRGFDYAPVIADGVLMQGVGGGVCQFATTLFNAVFFAGLPVVERHPHTFAIEHYPLGRDAAVSWGAADFKFRNDTKQPLMVRCWTGKGSLTVVIVGSTGRSVTYQTSDMSRVRKPAHGRGDPRVVLDASVSRGVTKIEQGAPGYSITVRRTVKENGALLFADSFDSTYSPRDWIKRVGTGT